MIPNVGSLYLVGLQASALATATYRLLAGFVPPPDDPASVATVWADLTEASWTGYAAATLGPWSAPYLSNGAGRIDPLTYPSFTNTSGADQTPTGWAVLASDGVTLVAWGVFPYTVLVPNGLTVYLSFGLTDRGA